MPEFNVATTYASLYYHVIFGTKHRAELILPTWRGELHAYLGGVVRAAGGVAMSVGGIGDHVHLLLSLRTTHCVADLMRDLKRSSSSWAQGHCADFEWQVGYASLTVGAERIPGLRAYIAGQEEHHRTVSSRDELLALLREAGIEPDMRFFE